MFNKALVQEFRNLLVPMFEDMERVRLAGQFIAARITHGTLTTDVDYHTALHLADELLKAHKATRQPESWLIR